MGHDGDGLMSHGECSIGRDDPIDYVLYAFIIMLDRRYLLHAQSIRLSTYYCYTAAVGQLTTNHRLTVFTFRTAHRHWL